MEARKIAVRKTSNAGYYDVTLCGACAQPGVAHFRYCPMCGSELTPSGEEGIPLAATIRWDDPVPSLDVLKAAIT